MATRTENERRTDPIESLGRTARSGLACLPCLTLLLAACSATPRPAPPTVRPPTITITPLEPVAEAVPDPAVLYTDLQMQIEAFETGLHLIAEGDEELGRAQLAAAATRLRRGTSECARLAGCDLELFLGAYDYLLDEQTAAIRAIVEPEPELETELPLDELTSLGPGDEDSSARPAPAGASSNRLRGRDLKELIQLNDPVRAALDDWLTWLRPQLLATWSHYQYLRPTMAPVYAEAGLPEALLFGMMATESGGKVHAHSRAGAAGPLQFIRATGRRYGLVDRDGFDLRYDPEASTRANVAYMTDLLGEFDGDLERALAAYNGGEGRVRRAERRYGDASFWDRRVYYQFPRETREYVPRVLAAAWLFLNPERYRLELARHDGDVAVLELGQEIALNELAICLGGTEQPDGWFRTLRNLNPRYEPGKRLAAKERVLVPARLVTAYEERCRGGELLAEARLLRDANYPERPEMMPYTVRSGDTLGRIASRHRCVSVRELAAVNNIRPPRYVIRTGQRLRIPGC